MGQAGFKTHLRTMQQTHALSPADCALHIVPAGTAYEPTNRHSERGGILSAPFIGSIIVRHTGGEITLRPVAIPGTSNHGFRGSIIVAATSAKPYTPPPHT